MKLVVESLTELFELHLPGKDKNEILSSEKFNDLTPNEMFRQSAEHGFIEGVKIALRRGVKIKGVSRNVILWLVENNHDEILNSIAENDFDDDDSQHEIVDWAIEHDHPEVIEMILQKEVYTDDSVVEDAVEADNYEIVKLFIDKETYTGDYNTLLDISLYNDNTAVMELILDDFVNKDKLDELDYDMLDTVMNSSDRQTADFVEHWLETNT